MTPGTSLNQTLKVDLHCHSYFSDGVLSPEDLIKKALDAQIELLALTDHDTVAGSSRLRIAAENKTIKIIDGVELSVRWRMHDIHILGLNVDIDSLELIKILDKQNEQRTTRARQISELLTKIGIENAYEKACAISGHERIGRPHLAQVLVNEGVVKTIQSAFKQYLGRGRLAYVPTLWISIEEAVSGIASVGGLSVIAHPLKYKLTRTKLHALTTEFKMVGGSGLEVVSGEMNVSQIGELAGLCERFELLASSGSDYHNDTHSRIKLGQQRSLPLNCKPIWEKWI